MKSNTHIEIVRTNRLAYSSMSSSSALKIQAALRERYERVGITIVDTITDLELLVRQKPDLVFLGLKKLPLTEYQVHGEITDIWISEYLDNRGIDYTGSAQEATKLDFNKAEAKVRVRAAGLATAPFFTAIPGQYPDAAHVPLPFPLFIKPLDAGGGKGIDGDSVVRTYAEFSAKVAAIYTQFGLSSLVEQYLTGREFSVAILEDVDQGEAAVMPIEIITEENAHGDRVLGYTVKHEDHELVIAVDGILLKAKLSKFAKDIYTLLGGRDLGRIDIRLDEAGEAYFLEANFMPAPGTRYYAGACLINEGMDYESVIFAITELGLSRSRNLEPNLEPVVTE